MTLWARAKAWRRRRRERKLQRAVEGGQAAEALNSTYRSDRLRINLGIPRRSNLPKDL
jgi:hypothetical protein